MAIVHTPKNGGTSLGKALAAEKIAACNVQTAGIPLCPCLCKECLDRSLAVIAECSSSLLELRLPPARWLFVAIVRQPRDWFFSAAAQWCRSTNAGRASARCRSRNTTASDLINAGWWTNAMAWIMPGVDRRAIPEAARAILDSGGRRALVTSKAFDFSLRYFEGPNEQSGYLGRFFKQSHYLICTLERIGSAADAVGRLLTNRSSLSVGHAHRTRRERTSSWNATVRWEELERFYDQDAALYRKVSRAGGCLARSSSAQLRDVLSQAAAPVQFVGT